MSPAISNQMDTGRYMQEALRLAETGMKKGDGGPFGAVIVRDDTIIGRGWNRVLASNDPTAHAEIMAIRDACSRTENYWLEDAEIFVNCEPCPMCLAAIYWTRIARITFGASREDAKAIGFDDALIYREVCLPLDQRKIAVSCHGRDKAIKIMQQWQDVSKKYQY